MYLLNHRVLILLCSMMTRRMLQADLIPLLVLTWIWKMILRCPRSQVLVNRPESEKHEPALVSNQVYMTAEENACDTEHISHKDGTDGNVYCSEPAGVIEQGANLFQDDKQYEKSSEKVGVADSERSTTDSKIEKININLHQEMNQSNSSVVAKDNPFKLIQGYASDDGSDSDSDPHFENLSPEAVSRQVKAESDNELHFENMSPAVSRQVIAETDNDFHFENISPQPGAPLFKNNDIETKNSP